MKATNKVVFNTGVLYAELIVSLVIGLFTTRLVLNAMGETNYGIYALVAGVISMLAILNTNMANTSMRYMAHSLGSKDKIRMHKTFNTTLYIHFIVGLIVVVIMEIGGWLMFEYFLNIPSDKIFDAKVVFQFMILTTFISVISVPYDAVMNAHENLLLLSIVNIFGNTMKMVLAIYLLYYTKENILIVYGFYMMLIQLLLRIIKQVYAKKFYFECKINFKEFKDTKLLKEILYFTAWNLFGSIASMATTQVRSVLMNMFFGVRINAAEGISQAASSKVNLVAVGMGRAINPQLIKSEGGGDREKMIRITEISAKYLSFIFALFAIPILLEASYLFHLWLKNVPAFAVVFFQLMIIIMLIEKFTFPITDALRAIGKIKYFQLTETMLLILIPIIAYFVFKSGYGPISFYIITLIFTHIIFVERLFFGHKIAGIKIKSYLKNVVYKLLLPLVISGTLACVIRYCFEESLLRLSMVVLVYMLSFAFLFWLIGVNEYEKNKFKEIFKSICRKLKIVK
ncbi:MAG TPA: MATE family efflux transporter [Bacteroidales bacterium]|nr:MATE family efflux transporter [Bacteroidales bacterium]